jgi:hypothetical protein
VALMRKWLPLSSIACHTGHYLGVASSALFSISKSPGHNGSYPGVAWIISTAASTGIRVQKSVKKFDSEEKLTSMIKVESGR